MKSVIFRAEAPSNIALIKYMGKRPSDGPAAGNLAANPSLSYTLSHLRTHVEIEWLEEARATSSDSDVWEPLEGDDLEPIALSSAGQEKFLRHWNYLKREWQIAGCFRIRSANTFPADCGLASSASSFAALTMAAHAAAKVLSPKRSEIGQLSESALAQFSRRGSGSSCRSFFPGWVAWVGDEVTEIPSAFSNLLHQVVVVSAAKKEVSSSEAHQRVVTSLLYETRRSRAEVRFHGLREALESGDWGRAASLIWADFWDMHALFETSDPAFGYMTAGSLEVLQWCRQIWQEVGDGPWVTMDAGSNVHLLYRPAQKDLLARAEARFRPNFRVLTSSAGGTGQ